MGRFMKDRGLGFGVSKALSDHRVRITTDPASRTVHPRWKVSELGVGTFKSDRG